MSSEISPCRRRSLYIHKSVLCTPLTSDISLELLTAHKPRILLINLLPTSFLALENPLTIPICTHPHTYPKTIGMTQNCIFPFQLPKAHSFSSVMVHDFIIFEAHFQIQFWYLKLNTWRCTHTCMWVCVCVCILLCYKKWCVSIRSDTTFNGSSFSPASLFVSTCFVPPLCLSHTWQTKPSIYQVF